MSSRFSEIRQMVRDELPNRLGLGTVVSTDLRGTRSVSVRLSGGRVCTRTLTCTDELAPGDEVIVARMEGRDRLIVLAKIRSLYSSFTTATSAILAPPNNMTVTGGPGLFIVEWDDYPGEVLCWQVQYNTADQEAGATDALVTRGSYYLYEVVDSSTDSGDAVTLYFRVRAIRWLGDNNVMYSAWSVWTVGTSATWDGRYYRENELSSHACDGLHGASLIWICDADDNFPSNVSDVEGALDYLAETGSVHDLFSVTHADTVAAAVARGYVVRGNATPKWERYDAKTNHFILVGDGNDITSKAFDWDDMAAGAAADMVHDHSAAGEGDQLDWDDVWSDAVHDHSAAGEGGQLDWDDVWSDAIHGHCNAAEGGTIAAACVWILDADDNFPSNVSDVEAALDYLAENPVVHDHSSAAEGGATLGPITEITIANTGLHVLDVNSAFDMIIVPGGGYLADRTLEIVMGDASRQITLTGNPTLNDWFDQSVKQAASPTFADVIITDTGYVGLGGALGRLDFTNLALDELRVMTAALSCPAQPGCRVYLGSNQTITSGGTDLVKFDTEEWDTNGDFNVGTYLFTAPLDGKYLVCVTIDWEGSTNPGDGEMYALYVQVNAATVSAYYFRAGGAGAFVQNYTQIVDVAQGETIGAIAYQTHGANRFLLAGNLYTHMEIHKIA